jgi:hypothetical protein
MAPPRKKKHAPGEGYEVKLRIPPDVMAIVEEEARASERAFNRTIVNLLASIPHLKGEAKLAASVRQLDVLLPAMAARMTWHNLQDGLLNAVDAVLAAPANAPAPLDKLRAARAAMLIHERQMKKKGEP